MNLIFEKTIPQFYMPSFTEYKIRALHSEFKELKKYNDKLSFFDQHFGIIPYSFPDFDPELRFFFENEKSESLLAIFKTERNNRALTERKFSFRESFIFNIKPANSNSSLYSNYILSIFLARRPDFPEWINKNKTNEKTPEILLEEANGIINTIEFRLQNEYDKSFKLQCMSVFYKGFYDAFCSRVLLPEKKRKFTELYLYAQGIIYADFIKSIKIALQEPGNPAELQEMKQLDLAGKLTLMNKLGLIDFLKTRFAGLDSFTFENKLTEIILLITSENAQQKDKIQHILSGLNLKNSNTFPQNPLPGTRVNNFRINKRK